LVDDVRGWGGGRQVGVWDGHFGSSRAREIGGILDC
jgi:hypothetical protein